MSSTVCLDSFFMKQWVKNTWWPTTNSTKILKCHMLFWSIYSRDTSLENMCLSRETLQDKPHRFLVPFQMFQTVLETYICSDTQASYGGGLGFLISGSPECSFGEAGVKTAQSSHARLHVTIRLSFVRATGSRTLRKHLYIKQLLKSFLMTNFFFFFKVEIRQENNNTGTKAHCRRSILCITSLVDNTVNRQSVFLLASAAEQPAFLRENHTIGSRSSNSMRSGFREANRPANLLLYVPIGWSEHKEAGLVKEMSFPVCVCQSRDGAEWRVKPIKQSDRSD